LKHPSQYSVELQTSFGLPNSVDALHSCATQLLDETGPLHGFLLLLLARIFCTNGTTINYRHNNVQGKELVVEKELTIVWGLFQWSTSAFHSSLLIDAMGLSSGWDDPKVLIF
jgi:hypothetical protein